MRTSQKNGFTLLEVLVVVMIIAIMTAITGLNLRGKQGADLESIGKTLVADLRYVRSKALVGSADSALTFDVASRKYFSLDANIDRSLPQEISIVVTGPQDIPLIQDLENALTESFGKPVTVEVEHIPAIVVIYSDADGETRTEVGDDG